MTVKERRSLGISDSLTSSGVDTWNDTQQITPDAVKPKFHYADFPETSPGEVSGKSA